MAQELIYTSAPRGLRVGSSGFCTVACTRGMAPNYVELLEALSGYSAPFPPHHKDARLNPTAFSHYRLRIGGKPLSVLSRVAFAGLDHTQRSNKLAHHLVLQRTEQASGGPAWVLQQPDVMLSQWRGEPRYLEGERRLPGGDSQPAPCTAWEEVLSDAGWAGVLAQAFLDEPRQPAFLIFRPGTDMLRLVAEALRLVPPALRWDVTFNTYFTSLPVGTACAWRCCLVGSRPLRQARRMPNALVIDLTKGPDQADQARRRLAAGSPLIVCAREGTPPPAPPGAPPAKETLALQPAAPAARDARFPAAPLPGRPSPVGDQPAPLYGRRPPRGLSANRMVAILAVLLVLSLAATGYLLLTRGRPADEREHLAVAAAAGPEQPPAPAHVDAAGPAEEPAVAPPPPPQEAAPPAEQSGEEGGETEAAVTPDPAAPGSDAEPEPPPVPPRPTTEFVSRVAEVTQPENSNLASKVRFAEGGPAYVLSLNGVTAEWQITEVGYSAGRSIRDADGQPNVFEMKDKKLGTDEEMLVVTIRPQDGGLRFEPDPVAQDGQIRKCLADVAWIELRNDASRRTLYVLTGKLTGSIQLRGDGQGRKLTGQTAVPDLFRGMHKAGALACVSPITDKGGYRAEIQTHLDQNSKLVINISYTGEVSEEMRQIRKQRADAEAALPAAEEAEQKASEALRQARKPIDDAQAAYDRAVNRLDALRDGIRQLEQVLPSARGEQRDQIEKSHNRLQEEQARLWRECPERENELRQAKRKHGADVEDAERRLGEAQRHVQPLRDVIARAEVDEGQDKQKRKDAFGQFRFPLQFKLNDEVVASFDLVPAAQMDR